MLKDILSNQRLNGVTAEFELKKPFRVLAEMNQREDWCQPAIELRTSILEDFGSITC
jgi:hypothetical protein